MYARCLVSTIVGNFMCCVALKGDYWKMFKVPFNGFMVPAVYIILDQVRYIINWEREMLLTSWKHVQF